MIPEGFQDAFQKAAEGGVDASGLLEGTGRPDSNQSYYARELAEGYLSQEPRFT